jgi:hypothetical protein
LGSQLRASHSLIQIFSFLPRVLIQVNEGKVVPPYREFSDAAAVVDNWGNEEQFQRAVPIGSTLHRYRRVQIHLVFSLHAYKRRLSDARNYQGTG